MDGFILNRRTTQRVAEATRLTLERKSPLPPQPAAIGLGTAQWFWAELLDDVDAPDDGWTEPTLGYAKIMVPDTTSLDSPIAFTEFGTGDVTDATNATPIVITSPNHTLRPGRPVYLTGVGGNAAANGFFTVASVTSTTFTLQGSVGDGAYTSGGTWYIAVPWTNRDPSLAATAGAIAKLEFGFNEWSLKWVGC